MPTMRKPLFTSGVWSTRRRECYDVSAAGAWSFIINASIRSAILCAGSRSCPMVQSAA